MATTMENNCFLSLLKDAIHNEKTKETDLDYLGLYEMSIKHHVSGLIYQQIYSFASFPQPLKEAWKKTSIQLHALQMIKTERILNVYQKFEQEKIKVIVVKGMILRSLYPIPENRPSNDEDLYVEEENLEKVSSIFIENGFVLVEEASDVLTFVCPQTKARIELHTRLFSEESKAYGNYQKAFEDAFNHLLQYDINGIQVYSLDHDSHLLFLILHFAKHFFHGGVGIRQIMDMVIYIEHYGTLIHWHQIYDYLEKVNLLELIENVIAIAHDHLGLDLSLFSLPDDFSSHEWDYDDLLEDILDAGIYGKSSEERNYSSTMTLHAIENTNSSAFHSLFLPYKEMKNKYAYLEKYPFLLLLAWLTRLFNYLTNHKIDHQKTIEIGQKRIALLKKYKVIHE